MRSLGSQGQIQYATDSYMLETARRISTTCAHLPGRHAMTRPTTQRPSEGLDPDYERELVRQAAATRRAIVLGALTVLLLVTLILAVVGVLPKWAPDRCRPSPSWPSSRHVMTASAALPARAPRAASTRSTRSRSAPPSRRVGPHRLPRPSVEDDWETWNAWDDEDSWEAVPTTLPDVRHRTARLGRAARHRQGAPGRVDRLGDGRDRPGHALPSAFGPARRSGGYRPRRADRRDPRRRATWTPVGPSTSSRLAAPSRRLLPFARTTKGL